MEEPDEDEAGVRVPDRELSASEADPFSDAGDALGDEEESGEDLHDEGQAVPMGCVTAMLHAPRAAAGRGGVAAGR